MSFPVENIEEIELIFSPIGEVDRQSIPLVFSDGSLVDPDWAAVTPNIKVGTDFQEMIGQRKVGSDFVTGQWYRCINPDPDPPVPGGGGEISTSELT